MKDKSIWSSWHIFTKGMTSTKAFCNKQWLHDDKRLVDIFCFVFLKAFNTISDIIPFGNWENTELTLEKITTRWSENWLDRQAQILVIIDLISADSQQQSEGPRGQFCAPYVFSIFIRHLGDGRVYPQTRLLAQCFSPEGVWRIWGLGWTETAWSLVRQSSKSEAMVGKSCTFVQAKNWQPSSSTAGKS